jgi:uncharacterized protein YmfQ (DUF2313 family)
MDALAYARQLRQLLPQGAIWPEEDSSVLARLLRALGEELARVEQRARDLLREWDPSTTEECLEDWERVLGLPDACGGLAGSADERRATVVRKFLSQGGASRAYFVALAAQLGMTVTIVELGSHAWRVDVAPGDFSLESSVFRMGDRVGRRLMTRSSGLFECILFRLKPAHTVVTFQYL